MRALRPHLDVLSSSQMLPTMQRAWVALIEWAIPVAILAVVDLLWRWCPNWLSLPIIAAGIAFGGAPALWSAVAVGIILTFAQFPSGDVKGAVAMAAWVPVTIMLTGLVLTLAVTIVLIEMQWYKLYQRAYRWPWLAGLALSLTISAVCGTLMIR